MTFREFMKENDYELQTTFWNDFTIADHFGLAGIQDTFNRAFEEWKDNCKYLTELTLVLNHKVGNTMKQNHNFQNCMKNFGNRPNNMQWRI